MPQKGMITYPLITLPSHKLMTDVHRPTFKPLFQDHWSRFSQDNNCVGGGSIEITATTTVTITTTFTRR